MARSNPPYETYVSGVREDDFLTLNVKISKFSFDAGTLNTRNCWYIFFPFDFSSRSVRVGATEDACG